MADPNQDGRTVSEKDAAWPGKENSRENRQTLHERIGRYRIVRLLGQGGFGQVYLAHDDELGRPVAIKVPNPERVTRSEEIQAYLDEARILASLDHPHIVPVFDVGRTEDGLCYVVSKFVEGSDLAARIRQRRPNVVESAELVATVAEALHYAHTRALVHRDIKPANILLDAAGKPYVADFGLALRDEDFGKGVRLAGTPRYMSPEQARGEGHRVDGRSDIFSLGVVLYELLTGRRPFLADSRRELLEQITTTDPRPPRQIDDTIAKELERICFKSLSKKASERYSTARDMAEDLRHFLKTAAVIVGPPADHVTTGPPSGTTVEATYLPATSRQSESAQQPLKIVPKGLRSFDEHDAGYFLELLPGPRDREGLPDSLRFWINRIEETDPDRTFSVGVIYGTSGCGKSSMAKAGLLPRLSEDVIPVYVEATSDETETRLLNGLRKRCAAPGGDLDLKETMAALRRGQAVPLGGKVLIVLDQFEQWLHGNLDRENTELVQALRQCDGVNLQCLVLVRDDFWMAVSRFMRELEVPLREGFNSAAVDLFHVRHAEKVLAAFGRAFGALPDDGRTTTKEQAEFFAQSVAGLAEDGRVICVRLALFAEMMKGKAWTPATLKGVGGTKGVGVTFLEETFAASAAPLEHRYHQKAARAVLKALLPASGAEITREIRSYDELLEASGYAGRLGDFNDLIRILDTELRLITPTDPDGLDTDDDSRPRLEAGRRYFQLTHDYLVQSLRDWLTRKQKETRRGRAELRLAECAANWNAKPENRRLPTSWEYAGIRLLTDPRTWTTSERRMMRVAFRVHGIRWSKALLVLAVLALSVRSYVASQDAYLAAQRDESRRKQAALLVEAVLSAPAEAVPYAIDNLDQFRAEAVPMLEQQLEGAGTRPARRLRAASVLAHYGDVRHGPLIEGIEAATSAECDIIVTALDRDRKAAIERLVDRANGAGAGGDFARKARCAIVLLHLGNPAVAREMSALRPDPVERMRLIATLSRWHGRIQGLVAAADDPDDGPLRSAICAGIGDIPPDRLSSGEMDATRPTIAGWYLRASDSGTHGASGWVLRQWRQPLPEITSTTAPPARRDWFVNTVGMTMARIPPAKDAQAAREDRPASGQVGTCWLSDREVSRRLFQRFVDDPDAPADSKPRAWEGAAETRSQTWDHPVQRVSWNDAVLFCNWLSRKEGLGPCYRRAGSAWDFDPAANGYRLPLDSEWESACRAGTATPYVSGGEDSPPSRFAVYESNRTEPCGSKLPNGWGLFDLHGNVYEWCHERWNEVDGDQGPAGGTRHGGDRVLRGGAFDYAARFTRSSERSRAAAHYRSHTIGFRPARNP